MIAYPRSSAGAHFAALMLAGLAGGCPASTTRSEGMDAAMGPDGAASPDRRGTPPIDAGFIYDAYVDPGCGPDAGAPPDADVYRRECDPYLQDCEMGMACYPDVVSPMGPCGDEVFQTICAPAGPGRQGEPCLDALECAGGFTCFVTGAGTRCLQLCDQGGGPPRCPRGLICGPADVPGYGACF